MAFKPPLGVGLDLDLGDAAERRRLRRLRPGDRPLLGASRSSFLAVGLGAVVVVDTQLPGDPTAGRCSRASPPTFPGLPLGFGFFLSGVGGLLCLNRTMDVEALAAGLKSGAVDAILFPDDPLGDAGR